MTVLAKFKGIDNVKPITALGTDFLRVATNVDVRDDTALESRLPAVEVSPTAAHSPYKSPYGLIFRQGNNLVSLSGDVWDTNLGSFRAVYASVGTTMYYACGPKNRKIVAGQASSWGVEIPNNTISATPSVGLLPTGSYLVAFTHVSKGGEESGATIPKLIEVVDGGILISGTSDPVDNDVVTLRVYVSRTGGGTLYWNMDIPLPMTDTIVSNLSMGGELTTLGKQPPPPDSSSICIHDGRAVAAIDEYVLYSDPFKHGLFDFSNQFVKFESKVTALVSIEAGLVVGTRDGVYILRGSLSKAQMDKLADCDVAPNSATIFDGSPFKLSDQCAIMATSVGFIAVSDPKGELANLTGAYYQPSTATQGCVAYNQSENLSQLLFVLN